MKERSNGSTPHHERNLPWITLVISIVMAGLACGQAGGGSGECPVEGEPGSQRRIGPFATQQTAIERRREYEDDGCAVSNGTFPCFDETFTRGHCFNVFFD